MQLLQLDRICLPLSVESVRPCVRTPVVVRWQEHAKLH